MEVSGQLHAPTALSPGKEFLDRRLGGPQNRSGRCVEQKNLALPGIKPGAVQLVIRLYADWDIQTPSTYNKGKINLCIFSASENDHKGPKQVRLHLILLHRMVYYSNNSSQNCTEFNSVSSF
jgi:hypothetical protein